VHRERQEREHDDTALHDHGEAGLVRRLCGIAVVAAFALALAGASGASARTALPTGLADAIHSRLGAGPIHLNSAPTWTTTSTPVAGLSNHGGIPDGFGGTAAISTDGTTAIVGASGSENNALIQPYGTAYIFHTGSPGSWASGSTPVATLVDGVPNDGFGVGVAISGDGTTAFVLFGQSWNHMAIDVFHVASADAWTSSVAPVATLTNGAGTFSGPLSASADGATLLAGDVVFHASSESAWTTTSTPTATLGSQGQGWQGYDEALSADGTTVLFSPGKENGATADLFHVASASSWTTTATPTAILSFGSTVVKGGSCAALSADGTTAVLNTAIYHVASPGAWADSSTPTAVLNVPDNFPPNVLTSCPISSDGTAVLVGGLNESNGLKEVYDLYSVASADSWTTTSSPVATFNNTGAPESLNGPVAFSGDGTTALMSGNGEMFAFHAASETAWNGATTSDAMLTSAVENGNELGYSVSLSSDGTTALVGAPFRNGGAGAAFIFRASSEDSWTTTGFPDATLVNGNDYADGAFGSSVSLSADGTTALVGAPTENALTGAAYVFHATSESSWASSSAPDARLSVGSGAASDGFGHSVALSGDGLTALIGADGVKLHAGAAYVFHSSSESGWATSSSPAATLTRGTAVSGDGIGASVALSADGATALVGAPNVKGRGAAYVFSAPSAAAWATSAPKATLASGTNATGQHFGDATSISADGTTALIGAGGTAKTPGAAYVFHASSATAWASSQKPAAKLGAGIPSPNGEGGAVALSPDGTVALVSGDGYAPHVEANGSAFVFTASSEGAWKPGLVPAVLADSAFPSPAGADLGDALSISADDTTALLGAPDPNGYASGLVWVYTAVPSSAGPPSKVAFSYGVGSGSYDWTLGVATAFETWVSVEDASGTVVVAGDPAQIKLTLTNGRGAKLHCAKNPAPVVHGSAYFACWIDRAGTAYTMTAHAAGLTSAASENLNVYPVATRTRLRSSTKAPTIGSPVTFTASTKTVATPGSPTLGVRVGSITFENAQTLAALPGCVAVSFSPKTGLAKCTTRFTKTGSVGVLAHYSGTNDYLGLTSNVVTETTSFNLLLAGSPFSKDGTAIVPLRCAAGAGSCQAKLGLSTIETLRAGKVVAVGTAAEAKPGTIDRIVTVGRIHVHLAAGTKSDVVVALNAAGRRLLAKFGRLPTNLSIVEIFHGKRVAIGSGQTVTVKP
jgi:hypothetical protein